MKSFENPPNSFSREEIPSHKNEKAVYKKIEQLINLDDLRKKLGKDSSLADPEILKDLAFLTVELSDKIADYDTILSDDVSARLVSLFLRKLANYKRRELKMPPVNTYFIKGGGHQPAEIVESVKQFLQKKDKIGKTLLVTEYIQSGSSIVAINKILDALNIDYDIAALSIGGDPMKYSKEGDKDMLNMLRRLYYGGVGVSGLNLYGCSSQIGVYKDFSSASAHPARFDPTVDMKAQMQKAREDINAIAEEFQKLLK